MALDDILMGSDDLSEMISEIPAGTLNEPDDILMETNSNSGALCNEFTLTLEISQAFIF